MRVFKFMSLIWDDMEIDLRVPIIAQVILGIFLLLLIFNEKVALWFIGISTGLFLSGVLLYFLLGLFGYLKETWKQSETRIKFLN